ncbi:hypothetical protein JL721_5305 [Aureococcus anophagefferens]|nr:hypothetical protein JL721_5305 [Aureococcus anophagefferens]
MTAPLAPSVRTHDYPSDFLEKWAEAAGCRAVADKLPPHAMPVGAAQISACLEHLAPLAPRLRQVVAVPAWDGKRIIGYALLHGLPPRRSEPRCRDAAAARAAAARGGGESTSSGAASPAPDSDDDVSFARARRPLEGVKAARGVAEAEPPVAAAPRADGAAGRATSASDLALFDAGLRAPLEALVSTLYLASVRDANPLHAIELLASAACQGRRTLLPWSGEWADPQAVGNGGDDDPCEAMAEEMGLDILDVAGAVHRGREFVEPVLELGLGSAGNGLFRALALFGAELVAQCSAAADRAAAPAPAPADDPADDRATTSPSAEAAVRRAADDDGVVDEDRVAVEDGAPEDDDEDEEDDEEDDDDDDDDEARVLGGLGGSAEDDDDDDLDDDMDDLDDMDDPDGLDDDDESFAALAETLLARALLGRDKSASAQRDVEGVERALSRSAARDGAPQGRVLPVVLVLAFEESVYVVLEARHDALLELSSPETLEACGPRGRSRSDSGADRDRVVIGSECWTGGGFGHVEVMMQLPQPLRLACDRSLLHHALLQLPPADAADDCTPWLTLALLPAPATSPPCPWRGSTRPASRPKAAAPEAEVDDDDGGPWRDEDDEDAPPWALATPRPRRRQRRRPQPPPRPARPRSRAAPEARATALEASDDDEESDEPERRATVSSRAAPRARARGRRAGLRDGAGRRARACGGAAARASRTAGRQRRAASAARAAALRRAGEPRGPALASFLGYRDGLKYNGPPLHSTTADALPPPPGGAAGAPPSPRPATELLKALAKCHEPHVSTASLRTALGDAAAIGATRARFAAVRCPKRALPSPLADGAAAKATTYLPHVHTLVATRRRPFLDDSSSTRCRGSKKKKTAAGAAE